MPSNKPSGSMKFAIIHRRSCWFACWKTFDNVFLVWNLWILGWSICWPIIAWQIINPMRRYHRAMLSSKWSYCFRFNSTRNAWLLCFCRRALQLLSSGLFLPGSNGLHDPMSDGSMNGHPSSSFQMTFEEQDRLCCTSQTLLRALSIHPRYVLGLEEGPDIFGGPCELNGVQFIPSEPVFSRNESNGETMEDTQPEPTATVETNAWSF